MGFLTVQAPILNARPARHCPPEVPAVFAGAEGSQPEGFAKGNVRALVVAAFRAGALLLFQHSVSERPFRQYPESRPCPDSASSCPLRSSRGRLPQARSSSPAKCIFSPWLAPAQSSPH